MKPRKRTTLRTRMALAYGSLLAVAGVVILALTTLLVQQNLSTKRPGADGTSFSAIYVRGDAAAPSDGLITTFTPPPGDIADTGSRLTTAAELAEKVASAANAQAINSLMLLGGIVVLIVTVIGAAIGWLVAGRMLHPIAAITATARRIADAPDAGRRMHERINLNGPDDEIRRLAHTFDGMLERLDSSFETQRRFVANASHELRTPLTVNRTLIEVAVDRPAASDDVKLLGESLLEVNGRHERLIDGLLLLARSERELTDHSYVDLGDVVDHVVDTSDAIDPAIDLRLDLDEAPTTGDSVLLEHLVNNVIGNAMRHNVADGGWVRVSSRRDDDGTARLIVTNSGPVVPPYEVRRLFEPFRRLVDERLARSKGAGLGLSISRAIVQAHGGEISLEARPDGGLVVTVTLPGATLDVGE
ncbi:MAG TPA: HAMP domain-containing sensor histidine kinase [Candidatus Lumbricidophila sp.]|nr:HAMP domain-containing sensor histidine kinase [Candidatus Lumbricidophila sp.]